MAIAIPPRFTSHIPHSTSDIPSVHFEEELDLDGDVEGQGVSSDGGADVAAWLAEDFHEEFAGRVGDLGLVAEAVVAGDEAADADDLDDIGERAEGGLGGGHAVDGALQGALAGFFKGDFAGNSAGGEERAIDVFISIFFMTGLRLPPPL